MHFLNVFFVVLATHFYQKKYIIFLNSPRLPPRHADPGDAAAGHPAHAGQCPPPLLLCLLHLWHSGGPAVGRWVTLTGTLADVCTSTGYFVQW